MLSTAIHETQGASVDIAHSIVAYKLMYQLFQAQQKALSISVSTFYCQEITSALSTETLNLLLQM